ncbi:MAG: succinate dehydrogenase [Chloroflexi bacterium]|nr:succinate dehydrogenase [Chloroflexota bacterium]
MGAQRQPRVVQPPRTFEGTAWKWMRYSGILLIPLAWIHVLIKDVLVGVHQIDLTYVQRTWAFTLWRIYDFLLLAFALSHGMNGLRQVLMDYIHSPSGRSRLNWILFIIWLIVLLMGAVAILGGVKGAEAF